MQETTQRPAPVLNLSIVTYNSKKWLKSFFESLLRQDLPCDQIVLTVLDNGSTDGTYAALQALLSLEASAWGHHFGRVHLHQGDNKGFGAGHNHNRYSSNNYSGDNNNMGNHNNFYDCRINNCSCYRPIDYYDTSNNYLFESDHNRRSIARLNNDRSPDTNKHPATKIQ